MAAAERAADIERRFQPHSAAQQRVAPLFIGFPVPIGRQLGEAAKPRFALSEPRVVAVDQLGALRLQFGPNAAQFLVLRLQFAQVPMQFMRQARRVFGAWRGALGGGVGVRSRVGQYLHFAQELFFCEARGSLAVSGRKCTPCVPGLRTPRAGGSPASTGRAMVSPPHAVAASQAATASLNAWGLAVISQCPVSNSSAWQPGLARSASTHRAEWNWNGFLRPQR